MAVKERVSENKMGFIKGFRSIALIEIFVCVCFLLSPTVTENKNWFSVFSYCSTGVLLAASILAFIEARKWKLWLLCYTMTGVTAVSIGVSIYRGDFLTTGFPLIAYNVLFIVANLHFLGKGLEK